MGWEQLGGRRGGKPRGYVFRRDGKQPGRERDAISRDGIRWEQKQWSGRGQEVAVGNDVHSGFPFPFRPVPDPTRFSRLDQFFPTRPVFPDPTITARTLGVFGREKLLYRFVVVCVDADDVELGMINVDNGVCQDICSIRTTQYAF